MSEEDCNAEDIRFPTVHRVGQRTKGRCCPIIVKFVSREDRDDVWRNKAKLKNSSCYKADAYVTEGFARAIQEERKIFIKAMMKARIEHGMRDAKVIGRFFFINNERSNHQNVPAF